MLGRILVGIVVAAVLALAFVIQTSNPSEIGPVGLLAVFFLLYVIIFGALTELILVGTRVIAWTGRHVVLKRPFEAFSLKRSMYFASVIALAPIMLLAMQSIGSLGPYEFGLVAMFLMVGILYITRRAPR